MSGPGMVISYQSRRSILTKVGGETSPNELGLLVPTAGLKGVCQCFHLICPMDRPRQCGVYEDAKDGFPLTVGWGPLLAVYADMTKLGAFPHSPSCFHGCPQKHFGKPTSLSTFLLLLRHFASAHCQRISPQPVVQVETAESLQFVSGGEGWSA